MIMEVSEIFKLVAANGIWAVLFLFLLIYELRDSRTREQRYMKIIADLSDRLETVEDISTDIKTLSNKLYPAFNCTLKESPTTTKLRGN